MNELWKQQMRRIDAMTLRERALMFVSLAFALVALADALVLSPLLAQQQALTSSLRSQSAGLDGLRATLAAAERGGESPVARVTRDLQQVRDQTREVDAAIRHALAEGAGGTRLATLLARVLSRHEGLTLLRLNAAPDEAHSGLVKEAAHAPMAPAAEAPVALPMQRVEIGVRGRYADLVRYVADTEDQMQALRWSELSITSSDSATILQAQVFLPGAPR